MRHAFTNMMFTLIAAFYFVSCDKHDGNNNVDNGNNNVDTCLPPQLSINPAILVYEGDSLDFNVISDGTTFSWTGPNGFTSDQKNPIIGNPNPDSAGEYTVTAKSGTCETKATSTLKVIGEGPCTPLLNRINLLNSMIFTTVTADTNSSGHFELRGTGADGDVKIEFYDNPIKRVNFVYRFSATDTSITKASMQVQIASTNETWQAVSGKLYFALIDNHAKVTFCSATMDNVQTGSTCDTQGSLSTP